jgi:hypothetical protein
MLADVFNVGHSDKSAGDAQAGTIAAPVFPDVR